MDVWSLRARSWLTLIVLLDSTPPLFNPEEKKKTANEHYTTQ